MDSETVKQRIKTVTSSLFVFFIAEVLMFIQLGGLSSEYPLSKCLFFICMALTGITIIVLYRLARVEDRPPRRSLGRRPRPDSSPTEDSGNPRSRRSQQ